MIEETVALYTSECSKRPSSKAAASEGARRTLRYVEPLSDARTPLEDFFSILLEQEDCHLGERLLLRFLSRRLFCHLADFHESGGKGPKP